MTWHPLGWRLGWRRGHVSMRKTRILAREISLAFFVRFVGGLFGVWTCRQIVLLFLCFPLPISSAHAHAAGAKAGGDCARLVGEKHAITRIGRASFDRA